MKVRDFSLSWFRAQERRLLQEGCTDKRLLQLASEAVQLRAGALKNRMLTEGALRRAEAAERLADRLQLELNAAASNPAFARIGQLERRVADLQLENIRERVLFRKMKALAGLILSDGPVRTFTAQECAANDATTACAGGGAEACA